MLEIRRCTDAFYLWLFGVAKAFESTVHWGLRYVYRLIMSGSHEYLNIYSTLKYNNL